MRRLLIAAVLAAVALTGCGSSDETPAEAVPTSNSVGALTSAPFSGADAMAAGLGEECRGSYHPQTGAQTHSQTIGDCSFGGVTLTLATFADNAARDGYLSVWAPTGGQHLYGDRFVISCVDAAMTPEMMAELGEGFGHDARLHQ